jgi:hypothetical protein
MKRHYSLVCQLTVWTFLFLSAAGTVLSAGEGYRKSLFNGQNLDGWIVSGCQVEVKDGVILTKAGNGLVRTDSQYDDFVLELKWKALKTKKWDAGIYFRFGEVPKGRPWPNRYQANLLEGKEGNVNQLAGAKSEGLIREGEWNSLQLTVIGKTAALRMNGKDAWKAAGLESTVGFIGLQVEVPGGGQFQFKDIYVTELKHRAIFNGKDLTGWEGGGQPEATPPASWEVRDGMLLCTGKKGTWLRSKQEYGDFNLRLDYKLQEGGNSGVFLRVPTNGGHRGRGNGVEVQILDDAAERYKNLKPYQYAGSVYGIAPATNKVAKPAGRWNTLEIDIQGTTYRVVHNGVVVVTADADRFPAVAERRLSGFIGFQNHKTQVSLRNLRIAAPARTP